MNIHPYIWIVTVVILVGLLMFDAFFIGRRPHVPTVKECTRYIGLYVGLAILFGIGVWWLSGARYAQEFYAGWLTEYSLSLDNLFIFLIIMEKQKVPRELQQFALLVGIMLALVLRGAFIGVGAVLISRLAWVFFLFGAYLLKVAWDVLSDFRKGGDEEGNAGESRLMGWVKSRFPTTGTWEGDRIVVRQDGQLRFTLIFFVIITLGTTDLMFALDSIPAIFGLTSEPYIVFTANVFALMGLRQLYFLLGDLLERLHYLSVGLFVLLGFIGVKLLLHAMHHYGLDGRWGVVGTLVAVVLLVLAALVGVAVYRLVTRAAARARGEAGTPARTAGAVLGVVCGVGLFAGAGWWAQSVVDTWSPTTRVAFSGEIPTLASLGVIAGTLIVTAAASLIRSARTRHRLAVVA
ncbi:MAG: TerC/Alx family metal homeostasis membrane protein, partial [Actinomycetia bacterium]|nr:TerC/Alx family metal homeostasis membrane protein [Actinomycetes bacterium]